MSFSTLMYHEIREGDTFDENHPSAIDVKQDYNDVLPSPLFIKKENFEEQMAYLYNNNYHTLTLDEVKDYYYNNIELPAKSVLLTFDDCYQSIKIFAYPILKKYNFHGVAFVVTNWLHDCAQEYNPNRSVCMAISELATISDVFEYANHTDSLHQRINSTTSSLILSSDEDISFDLDQCNSKSFITAKDVFAYPFGIYEERNVKLLKEKGFKLAFTSLDGSNTKSTDPLLLHRNAIPYFMSIETFHKVVKN